MRSTREFYQAIAAALELGEDDFYRESFFEPIGPRPKGAVWVGSAPNQLKALCSYIKDLEARLLVRTRRRVPRAVKNIETAKQLLQVFLGGHANVSRDIVECFWVDCRGNIYAKLRTEAVPRFRGEKASEEVDHTVGAARTGSSFTAPKE